MARLSYSSVAECCQVMHQHHSKTEQQQRCDKILLTDVLPDNTPQLRSIRNSYQDVSYRMPGPCDDRED